MSVVKSEPTWSAASWEDLYILLFMPGTVLNLACLACGLKVG